MLDGSDTGADGVFGSRSAVGMRRHRRAEPRRLVHHQLEILVGELGQRLHGAWIDVTRGAGGVDLDPVRSILHLAAHLGHERGGAVSERAELRYVDLRSQAVLVHVAAGDADRERRHLHARPRHEAVVDPVADGHIGPISPLRVDIPDRGEAGFERRPHRVDGLDGAIRNRFIQNGVVFRVIRLHAHVRVCVDEAGQHHVIAQIDDLGLRRDPHLRPDGLNPLAPDQDDGVGDQIAGFDF